jgi:hypothetical protein
VGEIDGNGASGGLGQRGEAAGMVVVLVGNKNGIERANVFPDSSEAFGGLTAAQARVDENAGAAGGDEGRVAGAAASEDANFDDKTYASLRFSYTRNGNRSVGKCLEVGTLTIGVPL